jgi:Bifunctional DNA primase/polymerase, N-terminal
VNDCITAPTAELAPGSAPPTIFVPDIPRDSDMLSAALLWANAGFKILPVVAGSKNPGSVVGADWKSKSSCDPRVIAAWYAATDYGIALDAGGSDLIIFDIDNPDELPTWMLQAFVDCGAPFQSSRANIAGRGSYFFRTPEGKALGNGLGSLPRGFGDIRGVGGAIILAPSMHAKAAVGGLYVVTKPGRIPRLPDIIAQHLANVGVTETAATSAVVTAFLDKHTTTSEPRALSNIVADYKAKVAKGGSRHAEMVHAVTWCCVESAMGIMSARSGLEGLRQAFGASLAEPEHSNGPRPALPGEFNAMVAWAVAQVPADTAPPTSPFAYGAVVMPRSGNAGRGGGEVAPELATGAALLDGVKASVATQLVELAQARYRLGQSAKHEPFAVPLKGSNVARLLRGAGGSLRAELAAAYFSEHRKVAPQQALSDAVLSLEGMAQEAEPEVLHLRSAVTENAVWLDLGDTTGRAIRITSEGWQVHDAAPVLFHRTALTAALPEPQTGGTLAELWTMLNVAPDDRPLVLAWLLTALLTPDLPCPVLALTGEQGTGKTTATKRTAALADPTHPQVRRSPKDGEAWVSAATGSRVVALDNMSSIPEWLSDALCRAVTGDGDVRRRLYSDGDYHVVSFRRAVVVNGIDLGTVRDDLAERLLTVQLARITEEHRGRESELERRWEQAHPSLLGAVLDLAVQVLAVRDTTCPTHLPRMADFAHTLATIDHVLGTDGLTRYRQQGEDMATDTMGSDPVLKAITATITDSWEGTGGELLEKITDHDTKPPKEWPGSAKAMTGELRRKAPVLRRLGWTVEDRGRGGKGKLLRWTLTAPDTAGIRRASGGHGGHEAGMDDAPCPPHAPPMTCEDTERGAKAGMAGIKPPSPLLSLQENRRERAPTEDIRARAESMPALPALPACDTDSLKDPERPVCSVCNQILLLTRPGRTICERRDAAHDAARPLVAA